MQNHYKIIVFSEPGCYIEVIHFTSDPGTWIVKRWKRGFMLKRLLSSDWFLSERQAKEYAEEMKQQFTHEKSGASLIAAS